ncbi:CAF17-like 4Fe-4S cluster assembly/insertion protein YgfZ [Paracraurococcus lichenis]|uniref:Folate-binding protein n=1 Tax=Paracraurococcus lichenis TaxID=3064888 RepID=A0ABT9DWD0_9PROT|nr:folate-binding protein [Paracraurococcus sp. LOR1-02]MDO9708206.1 folate-binding protein [Paracraurococcus sp. LOR1-02]
MPIAVLPERGVVEVAGEDRVAFLQGLVSNDVRGAAPGNAVFAALLTPQGKWVSEFLILAAPDRLLLDVERGLVAATLQRLTRFKLRSKVTLRDASGDLVVHAGWGGAPLPDGVVAAPDPRLPEAGWRALAPAPLPGADATAEDWDRHRLSLGLPEGSKDLVAEQTVLLEAGFDELHGVSWTKGCYMGQELTARTKYRGLVKRRLVPVAVEGPLPAPGTPVLADGAEVGEMRSGRDGLGVAQLRLEALDGRALRCGEAALTPRIPGWMVLPAAATA